MSPVDDKAFGQQEGAQQIFSGTAVRGEISICPSDSFFVDKFSSTSLFVIDLTGTQGYDPLANGQ